MPGRRLKCCGAPSARSGQTCECEFAQHDSCTLARTGCWGQRDRALALIAHPASCASPTFHLQCRLPQLALPAGAPWVRDRCCCRCCLLGPYKALPPCFPLSQLLLWHRAVGELRCRSMLFADKHGWLATECHAATCNKLKLAGANASDCWAWHAPGPAAVPPSRRLAWSVSLIKPRLVAPSRLTPAGNLQRRGAGARPPARPAVSPLAVSLKQAAQQLPCM